MNFRGLNEASPNWRTMSNGWPIITARRCPPRRVPRSSKAQRMDHFTSAIARQSCAVLSAGLILAFSSNAAFSAENCQQLEALANQYAGVELTSAQKQLKRKMAVWYSTHCVRHARR